MSKWFKYRSMARTVRRRALDEETFEMFSVKKLDGGYVKENLHIISMACIHIICDYWLIEHSH